MSSSNHVPPGLPFFQWVANELAARFDLVYTHIAEPVGDTWEKMRILGGVCRGDVVLPHDDDLLGTPCERPFLEADCEFPSGVASRFPNRTILSQIGAEGYYGTRIVDTNGNALGIVSAITSRPVSDFEDLKRFLAPMRPRLFAEFATRAAMREREALIQGTTLPSSGNVFAALAMTIARAMRVKTAFICESIPGDPTHAQTLGFVFDGKILPNEKIHLTNGPCSDAYGKNCMGNAVFVVPHGIQQHYPKCEILKTWHAEAYMAAAIRDSAGRMVGHIAIIHDHPIQDRAGSHDLLRMIAIRAGFELERHRVIEERVAIERRLLETQRLESLGLLAGGVAHDFNNLLVGIIGNTSLALSEIEPASPIRPYLQAIELAGQQASDLARQMLAYSGKGRFDARRIDLNDVVRDTISLTQRSIPRCVRVEIEVTRDPLVVLADVSQLRQVVMNLVLNAAEAIGDADGTVMITTRRSILTGAESDPLPPGEYAAIEVRDTGCGMDDATARRIFEPFFSTKFTGRGLGLAAVSGILRRHGASIDVKSKKDHGSTFRVLVPVAAGATESNAPTSQASNLVAEKGAVLVIDDEEVVRNTTANIVRHCGLACIPAVDGAAGIEAFHSHRPHIRAVLLDLTMPGMNGVEVLSELRRLDPQVRVILMTGFDESDALLRFEESAIDGPAAFLGKPFRTEDLAEKLRQLIGV